MKIPDNYHSAFKNEESNLKELDYYSKNDSNVFFCDINTGIDKMFEKCDFLYSEPAWQRGYYDFQKRAGAGKSTHKQYLESIRAAILELNKPTYIVGGKHMLKKLQPSSYTDAKLHDFDSIIMFWNTESIKVKSYVNLLEILSTRYTTIGDFSCGYGRHLSYFKRFICSDINKKCVYFVARKYMGYDK